jgi:glutathione S-transferase
MLLIGQYDSPFVRRVAVTLKLYGMPFEHAPWSTFGDAGKIAAYNPLIRVPTLVLDDGFVLMDSVAILSFIDAEIGDDAAFLARKAPEHRDLLRFCALAAGVADKGVSLLYERVLRDHALPLWVERCRTQMAGGLDVLERERAARGAGALFGHRLSHADIILATMLKFITEALPGEFDMARWPALAAHSASCEAMAVFAETYQPYRLVPPANG